MERATAFFQRIVCAGLLATAAAAGMGCGASEAPPAVSIADLRADADGDAVPDLLGRAVRVRGRLAVFSAGAPEAPATAFVQEGDAGIRLSEGPAGSADGDSIVVDGVLREVDGLLQLVVGASETAPEAALAGAEPRPEAPRPASATPVETTPSEEPPVGAPSDAPGEVAKASVAAPVFPAPAEAPSSRGSSLLLLLGVLAGFSLLGGGVLVWIGATRVLVARRQDASYRAIFEQAAQPVLLLDRQLSIEEANPAAVRLLKPADGPLRRRPLQEVLGLGDTFRAADLWTALEEHGQMTLEGSLPRDGDGPLYLDVRLNLLHVRGETFCLAILHDVTERREEEKLVRSLQQKLIHDMPLEVVVQTAQGQYLHLSAGTLPRTVAPQALVGKTDIEYCQLLGLHPEVALRRRGYRKRAVASKAPVSFEESLETAQGRRHFLRTYSPVVNARGEVFLVILYGVELTDLRALQVQVDAAEAEVHKMSRIKETLLQNLSHELRTPLTGIIGAAQLLLHEVQDDQREFVQIVERSGYRLMKTLNDILDLADLQGEVLEVNFQVVNLVDETRTVVRALRDEAEQKGLFLRLHATEKEVLARLDQGCLYRVLHNLIENAIKFTRAGGVLVEITSGEEDVQIHIMDSGIGMDEQFLPRLYDEFNQESSGVARQTEGVGIGLAITERLVGLLGGTITVDSEKGRGSMFSVSFKRAFGEAAGTGERLRVLVADDSAEEQRLLRHMLEPHFAVVPAASRDEAERVLREGLADVVLLDVGLGGGSAAGVLQRLHAAAGATRVPVVALGTHYVAGDVNRYLADGFHHYLPKPLNKNQLLTILSSLEARPVPEGA